MASIGSLSQANLDTNNHLLAFAFAERRIQMLLAARASLRTTGAVPMLGDVAGRGTDTLRERRAGLGHSLSMTTASSETQTATASSVTVEDDAVAVGRHWLLLENTYLAQIVDDSGQYNPRALAETFVDSFDAKWNDVLATAITSFATDIGSNAADNDLDDVYDAIDDFEQNDVDGMLYAMVHGAQLGHIRQSARAEAGALQFLPETQELMKRREAGDRGYQGNFLGIEWYRNNRVTESGGGKQGAIWRPGAIKQVIGSTQRIQGPDAIMRPAGMPLIISLVDGAKATKSEIVGNAFFGIGIVYGDLGRGFLGQA